MKPPSRYKINNTVYEFIDYDFNVRKQSGRYVKKKTDDRIVVKIIKASDAMSFTVGQKRIHEWPLSIYEPLTLYIECREHFKHDHAS